MDENWHKHGEICFVINNHGCKCQDIVSYDIIFTCFMILRTLIGTMTKHLNAKALIPTKQQQEQQWICLCLPVY